MLKWLCSLLKVFGPDDVFAKQACADLINRQSMAGTVDDYLPGYKKEICNILRRRMTLQILNRLTVLGLFMLWAILECCLS